jgi:hypothetical protein
MKSKYTYSVESYFIDKWVKLFTETRDFCSGYLNHAAYNHPRNAMRMIRSDGKVMVELKEDADVSVGMVASWPTPEQYESAAKRALEQAARIREQQEKHNKQ